jgi:hypothetical protein
MRAKDATLVEHGVDKRGLAMIDVRDDGDIADIRIAAFHGITMCLIGNWGASADTSQRCETGRNF